MSKKTRDIFILIFLFLVLYGVIYYNFVLVDAIDDVKRIQSKIESAEKEKKDLEEDLKNIEVLKRNLEMKNIQNERLEEYLMSAANLTDNIEYVDKLARLFESGFEKVKIDKPKELKSLQTKTPYYEFGIQLTTSMTYNEILGLIDYVEGGSRKVKVSVFDMKPKDEKEINPAQPNINEPVYDLNLTINMYSLSLSDIDKVYEYSRKRFNRFEEGDGVNFVPLIDAPGTVSTSVSVDTKDNNATKKEDFLYNSRKADIDIRLGSFLIAGQNFVIKGVGNDFPINFRQKDRASVKITFSGNNYHVSVNGGVGSGYNLSGNIDKDVISMFVGADFPTNIKENKSLGADIQIINNSGKRVDINLYDTVKRVRITDRNGNLIIKSSDLEKVYII